MEDRWMNRMAQFLDLWAIRMVVLSSLGAHLVLVLFAGIRRRRSSGARMFFLWLAYQLANWAAPYGLGNLSFGSTSKEKQLVAFWASFLLQHLGGPDNITAYTLEDNVLSARQAMNVVMQIGGATYVLYKHIYKGGGGGALLPASIIIFAMGVAKYVERALALRRGDLGNIRRSSKKKEKRPSSLRGGGGGCNFSMGTEMHQDRVLDDEQALMVAHNMFPFCRRAMTDSSVHSDTPDLERGRKLFSCGWENMCKVVEMELSLMYDIIYTKTAMVHTWSGYFIRVVSPLATAVAFFLFLFYSKDGQRRVDVVITYTLLASSFLLDMRWLLRALGSTWTYAFLEARPPGSWLYRQALVSGRWRRFRSSVLCAVSCFEHLSLRAGSSYRMWSGTVGQYCLLQEAARDMTGLCRSAVKKIGLEESWNTESLELSQDIKRLVFKRLGKILRSTYEKKKKDKEEAAAYTMKDIMTCWGQATTQKRHKVLKRFNLAFGWEFQEDILVWHIATTVFLVCSSAQSGIHGDKAAARVRAISALSEYLMFLLVVRQQMLPGLVLRSLYEVTRDVLHDIWREAEAGTSSSSAATTGAMKLARMLRDKKVAYEHWGVKDEKKRLVSDGAKIAIELLTARHSEMPQLLKLIFNVWVDKLLYAGTRCSRESHARQLSRGGELTTIVWILAERAGPFQIGQQRDPDDTRYAEKKAEPAPPRPGASGAVPVPPMYRWPWSADGGTPFFPQQMPAYAGPPALDETAGTTTTTTIHGDDSRRERTRSGYITLYPVD